MKVNECIHFWKHYGLWVLKNDNNEWVGMEEQHEWISHSVFNFLFSLFWVHLVNIEWIKQTLCVRFCNELVWGTLGTWIVIKQTHVLSFSISLFLVHLVIDQWIKETLCVSYFTELVFSKFGTQLVIRRNYVLDFYWVYQRKFW